MDPFTNAHFTVQPPVVPRTSPMDVADGDQQAGVVSGGGGGGGGGPLENTTETGSSTTTTTGIPPANGPNSNVIKQEGSDGWDKLEGIPEQKSQQPRSSSPPTTAAASVTNEPRSSLPPNPRDTQDFYPEFGLDGAMDERPKSSGGPRTKKKGTATLVKKTNRKSGGGGGKRGGKSAGRAGKKRRRGGGGGSQIDGGSSEVGGGGGTGSDGDEESDHGPYCICRGPDDHRWMIACDVCEDWFHGECVDIDKVIGEALIMRYVCPRCTDGKRNVTRYKKTCSLEGCDVEARMYGPDRAIAVKGYSVFCSDRHAEEWWEQLVGSLPQNGRGKSNKSDDLTREKFMGLLNVSNTASSVEGEEPWHVGKKPFGVPAEFWNKTDQNLVLTQEEQDFLSTSAAERYALAEEIVLNKKMQQLLDLANDRRKAAIATPGNAFDKDTCGYDLRLDVVGVPVEFAQFVKSPQGEAIFTANNHGLTAEGAFTDEQKELITRGGGGDEGAGWDAVTAGMCDKRRCRPHNGWYNIFTKGTRHMMKELARQAKEKLDAETRVREAAAVKYFRKRHEKNTVRYWDKEAGEWVDTPKV